MHHLTRAGPQLDGRHPSVLREVEPQHEIADHVWPVRWHVKRPVHGDDQVRLAEIPALLELRQLREHPWVALRHAGLHPAAEQADLMVTEAPLIPELAVSRLRLPWRHVAALDDLENGPPALLDVAVRHEFEWSRLPRAVACGAG